MILFKHVPACPIERHYSSYWNCPRVCDGSCATNECLCDEFRDYRETVIESCIETAERAKATSAGNDYDEGWNSGIDNAIDFIRHMKETK